MGSGIRRRGAGAVVEKAVSNTDDSFPLTYGALHVHADACNP